MADHERNLAVLREKFHDVKFDLEGTDYRASQTIGSGTYGVVCSALQHSTGKQVAIKKIMNIFENCVLAKRTLRELKILRHFNHENVIRILDILKLKQDSESPCDVYLVMDLMETDLYQIIRSKQVLTDDHIRYFVYQIACGLKYIHSANVIHRDLKPSNLLVNGNCSLKIADFGMARCVSSDEGDRNSLMTWYVATRWYRAPELMLFKQKYTGAVDVWSVGCILAELLGRRPIFPGNNFTNQIQLIFGILGSPNEDFVSLAHADRIKEFICGFGRKDPVPLKNLYPASHPKALRLLEKMLKLNPNERVSAANILLDLYLNQYHDPTLEPVCQIPFNFDLDEHNLDSCLLRRCIYEEIMKPNENRALPCENNLEGKTVVVNANNTDAQSTAGICGREFAAASSESLHCPNSKDAECMKSDWKLENTVDKHIPVQSHLQSLNQSLLVSKETNASASSKTRDEFRVKECPDFVPMTNSVDGFRVAKCDTLQNVAGENDTLVILPLENDRSPHLQSTAIADINTTPVALGSSQRTCINSDSRQKTAKAKRHGQIKSCEEFHKNCGKTRLARKGKKLKTVKPVHPVSLFNEQGERINVKAVLKNTILNGHQPGKSSNCAADYSGARTESKNGKAEIHLSEEDKNLLKRWSEMQKPAMKTNSESGKKGISEDSTVVVAAANNPPVLPVMVLNAGVSSPSEEAGTSLVDVTSSSGIVSESLMLWSPSVQLTSGDIRGALDEKQSSAENSSIPSICVSSSCPKTENDSSFEARPSTGLLSVRPTISYDFETFPAFVSSKSVIAASVENSFVDNLSPLLSSGKLSATGYGIEMETFFPEDLSSQTG